MEILSSYLDNALDPQARAELEKRLIAEPALAEELEALRRSDAALRAAFSAPLEEPVPDRFRDLLGMGAKTDTVIQLDTHRRAQPAAANDNQRRWLWAGGALAVSLAVGLLLTQPFSRPGVDAGIGDTVAFNAALDRTPMMQKASLPDGRQLTPQLSFASRTGAYCRQFEMSGATEVDAGVACKVNSGWEVKGLVKSPNPTPDTGGYATAGGGGNAQIDDLVSRLRDGDPLDPEAEKSLIADGWQQSR